MNNNLYQHIALPGYTTRGNLFLAPLAGFTDRSFRSICLDYGTSLCWSEMVSAEALARGSDKTELLMRRADREDDLVIQIFLSHYTQAVRALPSLLKHNPTVIDINCGCPVPKVVKTGAGSALMNNIPAMADIVKALKDQCSLPVSVKFRSGWDLHSINYLEFAQAAQEAGASLLTLHPRTRSQGYSGKADWSHLKQLAESTHLPVVGSGDAISPETVKQMLEETGVQGVMIGRAAVGNPYIFSRSRVLLRTGTASPMPDRKTVFHTAVEHLDRAIESDGEAKACREMRKQICAYTKGMPGSAELRSHIVHAVTRAEYLNLLETYLLGDPQDDIPG